MRAFRGPRCAAEHKQRASQTRRHGLAGMTYLVDHMTMVRVNGMLLKMLEQTGVFGVDRRAASMPSLQSQQTLRRIPVVIFLTMRGRFFRMNRLAGVAPLRRVSSAQSVCAATRMPAQRTEPSRWAAVS